MTRPQEHTRQPYQLFSKFIVFSFLFLSLFLCSMQNFALASSYPSIAYYPDAILVAENSVESADTRQLQKDADQGDVEAQTNIGNMYRTGDGIPPNSVKAIEYYELAANQGNAEAQTNLGTMYSNGDGVPQNYAKAIEYYDLAADQNDAYAQYNLGTMYSNGEGFPQNYAKAMHYYELAAKQGNSNAQFNLGIMYNEGMGVKQSYTKAAYYWDLAAKQGHASAQLNIGVLYANGEGVPQSYSRAYGYILLAIAINPNNENAKAFKADLFDLLSSREIEKAEIFAEELLEEIEANKNQ